MQITDKLIQRFCENRCTAMEKQAVIAFFEKQPEEVIRFFGEREWMNVQEHESLPQSLSQEMMRHIKRELFPQEKRRKLQRKILQLSAIAAASVTIVATMIVMLHHQHNLKLVSAKPTYRTMNAAALTSSNWIEQKNTTNKTMVILLPDHSKVQLQPNATLRYDKQFNIAVRNVYLSGEALFKVAKNRAKPFTVKTNLVNTTALGTAFTVSTNQHDVVVHLWEGKVVVRPAIQLQGWNQDVYLSPGERLNYNESKLAVIMSRPQSMKKQDTSDLNNKQAYHFDNTPLCEVMKKLSLRYRCKIYFNSNDIKNINFTGSVSKDDSLPVILRLIASMNDLKVEPQGNNFMISKP